MCTRLQPQSLCTLALPPPHHHLLTPPSHTACHAPARPPQPRSLHSAGAGPMGGAGGGGNRAALLSRALRVAGLRAGLARLMRDLVAAAPPSGSGSSNAPGQPQPQQQGYDGGLGSSPSGVPFKCLGAGGRQDLDPITGGWGWASGRARGGAERVGGGRGRRCMQTCSGVMECGGAIIRHGWGGMDLDHAGPSS